MSYARYYQDRQLTDMELFKIMERSFENETELKFTVVQYGQRRKLIGVCEKTGFRSFAYFTTCIEPAKKAIKTEYEWKKRQNSEVQIEF